MKFYTSLRTMPKFAVKVQGEHYKIEVKKRGILFRGRSDWKNVGFYTTRFVESDTANEAIKRVFEILFADIMNIGVSTENSKMELIKIQEDEENFDLSAPGTGFTFCIEEDI